VPLALSVVLLGPLAYAAREWEVFSYLGSIAAGLSGTSPSGALPDTVAG
jgi:hypothetical protein